MGLKTVSCGSPVSPALRLALAGLQRLRAIGKQTVAVRDPPAAKVREHGRKKEGISHSVVLSGPIFHLRAVTGSPASHSHSAMPGTPDAPSRLAQLPPLAGMETMGALWGAGGD